jgi:serine/threonine protein kinase/tetratricopeptide (TPR) repeat protein
MEDRQMAAHPEARPMNEEAIFLEALQKPSPEERATFLDAACAGNAELRRSVELLLKAADKAGSFLESPAARPVLTVDGPISERPGTVIGPYKLLQEIGEGGFGTVFMAEQTQPVQRKVALKVIKAGMDTKQVIVRFEAERQALAIMDHVNIARVLDAGATETGHPYFVMELVHGVPITKYCDDNRLTPRERLELFVPVCQAIQHAHQKGIIHRDVKPSNVMITLYDGKPVPKVIDFGVAKATEQRLTERTLFTQYGTMVGTFEYMSPEQAEMSALGVDTRSDIFSLGVLLYELLTGTTPLTHKRLKEAAYAEILRLIKEEEPRKPSMRLSDSGEALASISAQRHMEPDKLTKLVRGELDWIVMKCLEKDRNRRYETANGFAADVQRYLNDEPVQACPPSAKYRLKKFLRRNKRPVLAALTIVVLMVAGLAGTSLGLVRAKAERDQKEEARQFAVLYEGRARNAVKQYFTAVSEDPDLKAKGMEPLRRKLLATARDYYAQFVRERGEEPALRAELAAAHFRLGYIIAEIADKREAIEEYEQALALWQQLADADPVDAQYQRNLAASHHRLGNLYLETGQPQKAEAAEEKARTIFQRLANTDAAATEYQQGLAQTHEGLGELYRAIGRPKEAEVAFRQALAVRQRLVDAHPVATEFQSGLAGSYDALGLFLCRDLSQPAEAEAALRKALAIFQRLADAHPTVTEYPRDLARSHIHLGILYQDIGRLQEAEAAFGQTLAIFQPLADAHPTVTEYQRDLALSHLHLGNVYYLTRQAQKAEAAFRKALAIWQRLADAHPTVLEFQSDLAGCHHNLGSVYRYTRRFQEAETAFRKALAVRRQLVRDHPQITELVVALGGSQCDLGNLARDTGKPADALDWHAQAIATLEAVRHREEQHATARLFLRNAHWGRARDLTALARYDKALMDWDRAIELDDGEHKIMLRLRRADTLIRSGDHARAVAEANAVAAEKAVTGATLYDAACILSIGSSVVKQDAKLQNQYAVRAVELLTLAKGQGFFKDAKKVEHMNKDTDLDPLRARKEFKQFIAELEGKTKE